MKYFKSEWNSATVSKPVYILELHLSSFWFIVSGNYPSYLSGFLRYHSSALSEFGCLWKKATKKHILWEITRMIFCLDMTQTWNPSIYNIIRWVAWMMGQTNCPPSVWCSKYYYYFSWFIAKFFAKILSIYFLIFLKKLQNKNKEFWVP